MVIPGLIMISLMWFTVALLNLGYGEAKGTGFICGIVGLLTVICGLIDGVKGDVLGAGLLFAHGLLYICIAYALLYGLENLKSIGNVSLTVAFISTIYSFINFSGGDIYMGLVTGGYAVLTYMVWLNFYGKLSNRVVACSLIVWIPIGLWIPAFLLGLGKALPF
ncbi:hypothetical protein CACET_c14870 [Clostridium aceticum]|uniref:Uncharacterized protein n=1 Tax=Clostridium aceticum TaxID=84022 RepID=A0A0D8IC71_9CLOT|nr:AmiS/UreI family transporter [Clostridium aceticum]AKL94947.1 hypothetical protein CACET_c14870 [Clostridium aceticum]KJF27863.1 transporter [Clostridium aceticum]